MHVVNLHKDSINFYSKKTSNSTGLTSDTESGADCGFGDENICWFVKYGWDCNRGVGGWLFPLISAFDVGTAILDQGLAG